MSILASTAAILLASASPAPFVEGNATELIHHRPCEGRGPRQEPLAPMMGPCLRRGDVAWDFAEEQTTDIAPVASTPLEPVPPATPAPAPTVPPAIPPVPGDIVVTARPKNVPGDPLQAVNAEAFAITQVVDEAVIGPVAGVYDKVLPKPIRTGARNFVNNLNEPIVFLNFLLQFKFGKAIETLGRFAINSTLGLAGIVDVAKLPGVGLPRRRNGFANTLGYHGIGPGPFLFLPLIGPTTLRDLVGGSVDGIFLPGVAGKPFNQLYYSLPTGINRGLDRRVARDGQIKEIRKASDPYAAARTQYLERRQAEIDELRGKKAEAVPK